MSLLREPGSKLLVLGMVIPPLIGNPYNGYRNPYYWVDDHPLLYGNIGSLDPGTRNLGGDEQLHPAILGGEYLKQTRKKLSPISDHQK